MAAHMTAGEREDCPEQRRRKKKEEKEEEKTKKRTKSPPRVNVHLWAFNPEHFDAVIEPHI